MLVGGAGIGRLPDFIARDAVARGELVRLFPETEGDSFSIHALYTSHRSLSAKVRVFIDALVEYLATET
jgi:DNA-binding transcriptional LysR family regulator